MIQCTCYQGDSSFGFTHRTQSFACVLAPLRRDEEDASGNSTEPRQQEPRHGATRQSTGTERVTPLQLSWQGPLLEPSRNFGWGAHLLGVVCQNDDGPIEHRPHAQVGAVRRLDPPQAAQGTLARLDFRHGSLFLPSRVADN